jgi:hypothetical protein
MGDILTDLLAWLSNFLSSLQLPNLPTIPTGVPVVLLIVATILTVFIVYVIVKEALLAVLALLGLGAVWFFLSPLYEIVLFSSNGLVFTAMDVVLLALIAGGLYLLTRSKGGK